MRPQHSTHHSARPISARFWSKVEKSDGCWIWTAHRDSNGYGRLSVGPKGKNRAILAHRISWELHFGAPPDGVGVLHRCDNPSCVRPDHLFLGDQSANMRDCSQKDRTTRGERSSSVKLTAEQVREIRCRYAAGNISQAKLAREYGLCQASVSELLRRVTWHHLD